MTGQINIKARIEIEMGIYDTVKLLEELKKLVQSKAYPQLDYKRTNSFIELLDSTLKGKRNDT